MSPTPDQFSGITREDGLTLEEGIVADALSAAAVAFGRLEEQHPAERQEFANAIHMCQHLLVIRIARRHYPVGWPVKKRPTTAPLTQPENV